MWAYFPGLRWSPGRGEFCFDWLAEIIDRLYENGIYTVLATPYTWMGVREHHGGRHNHCMSSPIYREKVAVMDRKLLPVGRG